MRRRRRFNRSSGLALLLDGAIRWKREVPAPGLWRWRHRTRLLDGANDVLVVPGVARSLCHGRLATHVAGGVEIDRDRGDQALHFESGGYDPTAPQVNLDRPQPSCDLCRHPLTVRRSNRSRLRDLRGLLLDGAI